MTGALVLVAFAVGGFVVASVLACYPPPRRLDDRVAPYVQSSRAALGSGRARTALFDAATGRANSFTAVFGPIAEGFVNLLGRVVDIDGPAGVERRLRHSGLAVTMTVEQYRRRQAVYALLGVAAGFAVPAVTGRPLGVALGCAVAGWFLGATRLRNRTTALVRRRCEAMRASLYTVCHLIAVHMATSSAGLLPAVASVARQASGPISDELTEVLNNVRRGENAVDALERAADLTAEPSAAHLYRMLAAETRGGDPTAALMELANTMRLTRRDELERSAIRRNALMLIPLLTVIAPVMVLFVLAAVPSMLFRLTR